MQTKAKAILFLTFAILINPTSPKSIETDSKTLSSRVVNTRYGALRGYISGLPGRNLQPTEVFLGVPYAGAPKGPLRFMPPVTSPHWKGVRLADQLSPVCPQKLPDIANETLALEKMPLGRYQYLRRLLPYLQNQSEDCLYLNIYAPSSGENFFIIFQKRVITWYFFSEFPCFVIFEVKPNVCKPIMNYLEILMKSLEFEKWLF